MSADQELQIVDPVHSCLLPCGLAMLLHPHSGIVLQRLPPKGLIPERHPMKKIIGCLMAGFGIGVATWWVKQFTSEEDAFRELLRGLTVGSNPDAVLYRVAERSTKLIRGTAAYVERVDVERDEVIAAAVYGTHGMPPAGTRGPYHGSVAEQVIRTGEAAFVRDVSKSHSILASMNHYPAVVLPLISEGEALGALIVIQGKKRLTGHMIAHLQSMADTAAVSLRRASLLEEVRQLLHNREEMLRVLAHDLRNPVNTISMATATLRSSTGLGQTQEKVIEMIERSAGRMNRLIQDLIDNAVIEHSGKLPMNAKEELADNLAEEVCELTRIQAKAKTVHLRCQIEGRAIVIVDRDRLLQVLTNLIDNAIKFTPEGGTVTVKSEVHQNEVRFSVSDTGPGIAKADRDRIFQPFWQAPATAHLGAGLGLAIA